VNEEQLFMIAAQLEGTTSNLEDVLDEDEDQQAVEDALLELGLFTCANCGWWATEAYESVYVEGDVCAQCSDDEGEGDRDPPG
jgi:hypothetical protein